MGCLSKALPGKGKGTRKLIPFERNGKPFAKKGEGDTVLGSIWVFDRVFEASFGYRLSGKIAMMWPTSPCFSREELREARSGNHPKHATWCASSFVLVSRDGDGFAST